MDPMKTRASSLSLPVLFLLALLLAGAAHARNSVWASRLSLWEDTAAKSSLRPRVHNNLGQAYSLNGMIYKAREQYRLAAALDPDYAEAYFNLGISYLMTNDPAEARRAFELALQKKPDMKAARLYRKYAYMLDSPRR